MRTGPVEGRRGASKRTVVEANSLGILTTLSTPVGALVSFSRVCSTCVSCVQVTSDDAKNIRSRIAIRGHSP